MRASYNIRRGLLKIKFTLDEKDLKRIESQNFSMNEIEVFVKVNERGAALDIHPDLVGLSIVLLCNPFVGESLVIEGEVSDNFIQSVQSVLSKYKITRSENFQGSPPRKISDGLPALAFSGGADSSAALAVMPRKTIPIFLKRYSTDKKSKYKPDAPLTICEDLIEAGYDIQIVETNLEHLREPVGFPTDLANAIPAVLLADSLGIKSISFGTIMESGYGVGHEQFVEYGKSAHWRFFSKLFDAAGIELSFPVMGVSEVGTAIIGRKSPFGYFSQSCIRGTWKNPCLKCWKCFRKELLSIALWGPNEVDILEMLHSSEVQIRLSAFPISHENVVQYSLQRIELEDHPYLKPIADKLDMNADLDFLNYWYSPSIDFVPDDIRNFTRDAIIGYLGVMGPSDEFF